MQTRSFHGPPATTSFGEGKASGGFHFDSTTVLIDDGGGAVKTTSLSAAAGEQIL